MAKIGAFTPDTATLIHETVRRFNAQQNTDADQGFQPPVIQAVYRVKITGAADGNGVYPGLIMLLNPTTLAWEERGECYVYKADTI